MLSICSEGLICIYRRLDGAGKDCEYVDLLLRDDVETVYICYNGKNHSDGHNWGMRVAVCNDLGKYLDHQSLLNPELSFWHTKKYYKAAMIQNRRSLKSSLPI